jgi:hypothetical protein
VRQLAADIKRRTIHMHSAIDPKRAAIETELKSLQAVYDKVIAAEKAAADDSRSLPATRKATGGPPTFESRVTLRNEDRPPPSK